MGKGRAYMTVQREVSSEPLCPGNVKKWATVTHTPPTGTQQDKEVAVPTWSRVITQKTVVPSEKEDLSTATQKQHCPESMVSPGSLQVETPGSL